MSLATELMWRGITPPPPGINRTTCPHCSPTRRKSKEKCLQIRETDSGHSLMCYHCGWEDTL